MQQATQHFSVVADSGGSQMSQRVSQVGIDPVWREFGGLPWKPSNEALQLLQVAGRSADSVVVLPSQVDERHVAPQERGFSSSLRHGENPPQKRYGQTSGQLAQLVSSRLIALCESAAPILKVAYLAGLTLCIWLHRWELCLGLLVVGQFREAFRGGR
jgi:hypothetical protein